MTADALKESVDPYTVQASAIGLSLYPSKGQNQWELHIWINRVLHKQSGKGFKAIGGTRSKDNAEHAPTPNSDRQDEDQSRA